MVNSLRDYFYKLYGKSKNSYYKLISESLKNEKKEFIITVNPETLMISEKDKKLEEIMNSGFSFVPDGIAIVKVAKMFNIDIKERITGIDIAEFLLKCANDNKYSIYLFGSKENVIENLVNKVKVDYPNINILGYSNGYVDDKDLIMKDIILKKPDICMVALGIPEQEKLIYKYYDKFDKGIFVGVGGSFDVLSGNKKRAPKIFIKLNLEWLYRILKEPRRLKRFYNNNIIFLFKLKKEAKR